MINRDQLVINHIQNKSFCLESESEHNMCVYRVHLLCIYKYTHMHVYLKKYLYVYIHLYSCIINIVYFIYNYNIFLKYIHACVCIYIYT